MILFFKKGIRFICFFPQRVRDTLLKSLNSFILNFTNKFSFLKLIAIYFLLFFEKLSPNIGHLWSKSSWKSAFAFFIGNRFNINHLGNVYSIEDNKLSITQKIEKQVIEWNKKIISCNVKGVEGYVTSGGTESNLFLMWVGREYLKEKNTSKPILLTTDFTHYSISKAGRILDINLHIIKTDKNSWGMSLIDLEKNFLKFIKKKKFSFLLPITVGYSSTGASDPFLEIIELVKRLKKQYTKFECYMWIDAAAQGLPKSFLENDFKPLRDNLIQGYVVDFHKYGEASLPSGVVLYRGNLRKIIEAPIPYLSEDDSTILGSRPGAAALAIWANINSYSLEKWRKKFSDLEKIKNKLVEKLRENNPEVNILSFENSLTFAVEINSKLKKLPREFGDNNSFVKCNINNFIHYKFHIQ